MVELQETLSGSSSSIASDLPRGVALLSDLTTNINTVTSSVYALSEKIKAGEFHTAKGLSLLELKNQSFLTYMTNLAYVTLRKLKGAKLENDPCIDRLVEMRTVLERIRPLEDKLKYQIDKFVKTASDGVMGADHPLRLKGNLDNIGSSSDEEEEQRTHSKSKKNQEEKEVYKIPKVSQTPFDEDETKDELKEKARRRVLKNSSMVRDFLHEHTEDPEVIYNMDTLKHKAVKKRQEIERYEEANMMRKSVTRKERASMRQITTLGTMGSEILGFSSVDPLNQDFDPSTPASKKRKLVSSGKSKKKGKAKGKKGAKKMRRH